jgi:hypothetical protein
MVAYYNQEYRVKAFEMDVILRVGKKKYTYGCSLPSKELDQIIRQQKIEEDKLSMEHVTMYCYGEMLKKLALAKNKDTNTTNIDALICELIKNSL